MEDFLHKVLHLVVDLIILLVIFKSCNFVIKKIFQRIINRVSSTETQKQIKTIRTIVTSIFNVFLVSTALIHILYKLGLDLRPLLATAGVMGIAIGFGAKRMVEDIVTGVSLIIDGQIRVGDVLKIGDITGTVEKFNIRNVILRDAEGTKHFIRNSIIDVVSNYTRDFAYAIIDIQVAYKENIAKVIDIIKSISYNTNDVIETPEIMGLDKFGQFGIIIKIRVKTLAGKQWQVQRMFNLLIKEKFDEEKIEIPFQNASSGCS